MLMDVEDVHDHWSVGGDVSLRMTTQPLFASHGEDDAELGFAAHHAGEGIVHAINRELSHLSAEQRKGPRSLSEHRHNFRGAVAGWTRQRLTAGSRAKATVPG